MKILNKIIVITIVIIGVLIGVLFVYNNKQKEKQPSNNEEIEQEGESKDSTPYELEDLKEDNTFFAISDIIQEYYNNLNSQDIVGYGQEERAEYIYKMLTPNYIKENNITTENIFNVVKQIKQEVLFTPLNAKSKVEDNYIIYSMSGILEDKQNNKYLGQQTFFIYVDHKTYSYAIEPIQDEKNIEEIELSEIQSNNINKFKVNIMNVQKIIEQYMLNYKKMMLYYPEKAFNLLDEQYRNIRFEGDVNKYKEFVSKYNKQLSEADLQEYLINNYDNYTEYVCRDQYKNVYIFKVTATMQYSLKLDNYTILTEKFKETYKTASDITKVKMNVERFVQMLNNHDYITAYKLLDNKFKETNFPNVEDFENYIREHYLEYNDIAFNDCSKEGEVYICKITLVEQQSNSEGEGDEMSIVMKLEEETDFVMSFDVSNTMEE